MTSQSEIVETITTLESEQPSTTFLYLIKKTASEKEDKKFKLTAITIDGDPVDSFSTVLKSKLSQIKSQLSNNKTRLLDFYDEGLRREDVSQLQADKIWGFSHMIENMGKYDQLRYLKNLGKTEEKFDFYACEFTFEGGRVIYFRKLSYNKLISKDTRRFWYKFTDGKFTKIKGDIFTFDEYVDCIYIESLNTLLVFDKRLTENMFGFTEYYVKYAINKLKNLQTEGLIAITKEMLKLEDKIQLCRRITSTDKNNRFNKTVANFQKCADFFKANEGKYIEKLTRIDIQEDKLNIDTMDKLETFAHLSNQDIVRDIMTEELFISFKKESLRRK